MKILGLGEFKEEFDVLLARELEMHIAKASSITTDSTCHTLLAYVQKLALAGGKRIRPYAAYLMYRTAGGDSVGIPRFLVAFEIFHLFALIHDDIIDHGVLRHGVPSLHEFAKSLVTGSSEKTTHLAEGLALLVGDLCFNWSKETFAHYTSLPQAESLFNDMVHAVVIGQMLDVQMVYQQEPSEEKIMEKTSLKTAEYTFVYPFKMGASVADAFEKYEEACETLGLALGIAFQIQDDLIDILGSSVETGKRSLQDMGEGQHTIFTAHLRAHAAKEDLAVFDTYFGKHISDEQIPVIQELFERTGSIAYGKDILSSEMTKAKQVVNKLSEQGEIQEAWNALIRLMESRIA